MDDSPHDITPNKIRCQLDHLVEIVESCLFLFISMVHLEHTATKISESEVGIEGNSAAVVWKGGVCITETGVEKPAIVISLRELRLELDCSCETFPGFRLIPKI